MQDGAALANLTKRSTEDLVLDAIQIGHRAKRFSAWFETAAPYLRELRHRLPRRGPNCIAVIQDGVTHNYKWSEFCQEFLGVTSEWVRRLLKYEDVSPDDPDAEPQPEHDDKEPVDSADTHEVSKLAWETLEHKAAASESRYILTIGELRKLLQEIEKVKDKLPPSLIVYCQELEKRLAALDVEPPTSGNNLKVEDDELVSLLPHEPDDKTHKLYRMGYQDGWKHAEQQPWKNYENHRRAVDMWVKDGSHV
jgi:hypothetical protein